MLEDELISACKAGLHEHDRVLLGSGDDCAVLAHPDGRSVITTDTLVQGSHFRLDWSTPEDVGRRAAVQNMADIAAMGAVQHAAVVGITVPEGMQDWVVRMAQAFRKELEAAGGALVGGDITSGPLIVITVTLIGDLRGAKPLLRSGARPGDAVILAGQQGWSQAGLELLLAGVTEPPGTVDAATAAAVRRALTAFRHPTSPLRAGELAGERGQAHALMDVSDGLTRDLGKICRASGVQAILEPELVTKWLVELAPLRNLGIDVAKCFFTGGEDHALVGACAPQELPAGFQRIGSFVPGNNPNGNDSPIWYEGRQVRPGGWDHFASEMA